MYRLKRFIYRPDTALTICHITTKAKPLTIQYYLIAHEHLDISMRVKCPNCKKWTDNNNRFINSFVQCFDCSECGIFLVFEKENRPKNYTNEYKSGYTNGLVYYITEVGSSRWSHPCYDRVNKYFLKQGYVYVEAIKYLDKNNKTRDLVIDKFVTI